MTEIERARKFKRAHEILDRMIYLLKKIDSDESVPEEKEKKAA